MERQLTVSRIFNASIDEVWKIWTEPEYVMQWWGPDQFTCPLAKIDFREGRSSLVSMKAPEEYGGKVHYNIWAYTKIIDLERIEFIMNLADQHGHKLQPIEAGMPPDFPEDIRTVITFKKLSEGETEMTVTEYANFGQMTHFARLGLEQSLSKAVAIFKPME